MTKLRLYQKNTLSEVSVLFHTGTTKIVLVMPTGSGKTTIANYMLGHTNKRVLILAHRDELVDMISSGLSVDHAVIKAGRPITDARIQIGMMQTVAKHLDKMPNFDWVISDEAHLALAPTWLQILRHYDHAWQLGMSATPCRLDGKGLGEIYEKIVYGPSIQELTKSGYLVPCRVYSPAQINTRALKASREYNLEQAADLLNRPAITGDVIGHFRRLASDRRTIVFCSSRKHADDVAAQFRDAGISAANVDGAHGRLDRRERIDAFRSGQTQVLCNVDLLTTGFDCPEIGAAIMLRPTQSLALYLQMIGRILRPHPSKRDAILIDHVGAVVSHGMPDATREWTLQGRVKSPRPPPVRECQNCFRAHSPAPKCPSCGYVYPAATRERPAVQVIPGTLEEMTPERIKAIKEAELRDILKFARTEKELKIVAKIKGYDWRWVGHIMRARKYRSSWAIGRA